MNHGNHLTNDNNIRDSQEDNNTVLHNSNQSNNGNPIYGGVVLKSTLRRKTGPENTGTNGLNKPKISRPIPPPKPKKAISSLKKYQDESVDGSEV